MTFHVVVLCCVTLFLLLVSALVSGSETAFFSLSGNDVRKIRRHDTPVCRRMLNLLGKADLLLATILVVNNLVNIGIVILSSEIIDSLFTFARFEFLFKTVIVTFLLLLFGRISFPFLTLASPTLSDICFCQAGAPAGIKLQYSESGMRDF